MNFVFIKKTIGFVSSKIMFIDLEPKFMGFEMMVQNSLKTKVQ